MHQLTELLKKLGLSEERGILFRDKTNFWSQSKDVFNFEIIDKLNRINPDAVYHFNNQPFILFFDLSDPNNNKSDKLIYKEVWSWDKVPVIFIVNSDGIKVYNAFHYQKELKQLEEIQLSSEERNKCFSFWELQSGGTWKWLEENIYKKSIKKHRVNYNLFNNIKAARVFLSEKANNPLNVEFANILILRLIFIRYLIDRNVIIDNKYINGDSIEEKKQSFNQLIQNHNLLGDFFEYLKIRFNGNLFETENDPNISNDHLNYLSNFFAANLQKEQYFIPYFNVFDFSIIPVETISGIYESVIDDNKRKENSAVYTPLFLVDYILQNTIDKHLKKSGKSDCKVLDPSVGSGIFLTQTYRRLVEKEKEINVKVTDIRLKEIATQNLFGIDKDINALNVAAFSIYISILDYKNPKEIENFRLPNLIGDNLFHNDFFNEEKDEDDDVRTEELNYHPYNEKFKQLEFSYILGNPPWGRKNNKKRDYFHLKYKDRHKLPLSNDEIAQSFLFRSKEFHNSNTTCSLIVTSKAFYNNWAEKFKKRFFKEYFVEEIFDLSAARRMVFEGAISPAIVLRYKYAFNQNTEQNVINHLSIKANRFLKDFRVLVIGKQDKKTIQQKNFIDYPWMMKVALYGNTYDFILLKKFRDNDKNLNNYLNNNEIHKGDGILKKNKRSNAEKPFIEIFQKPIIDNSHIDSYYSTIKNSNLVSEDEIYLKSGGNINYYNGNQILIKAVTKNESDIVVSFVENNDIHVFRHCTFGITSQNKNELFLIYGFLISQLFSFFQFLTCASWGISTRPEINFKEYLSFPFIEPKIKKKFISLVENFINYYKTYYSQELRSPDPPNPYNFPEFKEINRIVNETYQVNHIEKDMIDYVLDVSRYQFQEGKLKQILRPPTIPELKSYAQVFFEHYGNIYNENNQYFQIEVYQLGYFSAMKFIIVPEKPTEKDQIKVGTVESEEKLFRILSQELSIYEVSNQIFIQKNVMGFEKDWFYIIKPNEFKSWHRAMAHYDIAEFDNEIIKAEIDDMTSNG